MLTTLLSFLGYTRLVFRFLLSLNDSLYFPETYIVFHLNSIGINFAILEQCCLFLDTILSPFYSWDLNYKFCGILKVLNHLLLKTGRNIRGCKYPPIEQFAIGKLKIIHQGCCRFKPLNCTICVLPLYRYTTNLSELKALPSTIFLSKLPLRLKMCIGFT